MRKIYLDNASTSYPKPQCVIDTMVDFMKNIGCNPGRGGYEKSVESDRIVYDARKTINDFFNGPSSKNVIFTQNITMSLNTIMKGMFKKNWHIITTSMEHNSVMRPLRSLERERDLNVTVIKCSKEGFLNPDDIKNAITRFTRAVVMTHASNITGTILPAYEVGKICRENGLYFILDSAQTAGTLDIDFKKFNIDALAFTGHKSLLGPPGTGGFIISDFASEITSSLIEGGTGSESDMENQPEILPDKYEGGTLNTPGIASLKSGIDFIKKKTIDKIRRHEQNLTDIFLNGLSSIDGITVYGPRNPALQTGTVSINIKDMDPSEVSFILDSKYGIMTRSGLHCAPSAHKTIETFPKGTVRFSIGYFNTEDEIGYTLDAIREISDKN
ncbi:MAG: aminotransferase class V-fold PLP-dependent enzyme [Clostridiales bacterium]|nr:aminotransferase class V-fold PLP-dependent enzyme [Clostridiales bacterium]